MTPAAPTTAHPLLLPLLLPLLAVATAAGEEEDEEACPSVLGWGCDALSCRGYADALTIPSSLSVIGRSRLFVNRGPFGGP
ncbi:unnamed protein product [Arctogadus glacialis]